MNVQIIDWCMECQDKLKELGYEDRAIKEVSESEYWDIVKDLYSHGLDVMLTFVDGTRAIAVDTRGRKFRQR